MSHTTKKIYLLSLGLTLLLGAHKKLWCFARGPAIFPTQHTFAAFEFQNDFHTAPNFQLTADVSAWPAMNSICFKTALVTQFKKKKYGLKLAWIK